MIDLRAALFDAAIALKAHPHNCRVTLGPQVAQAIARWPQVRDAIDHDVLIHETLAKSLLSRYRLTNVLWGFEFFLSDDQEPDTIDVWHDRDHVTIRVS